MNKTKFAYLWVLPLLMLAFQGVAKGSDSTNSGFSTFNVLAGTAYTTTSADKTGSALGFQGGMLFGFREQLGVLTLFDYIPISSEGQPLGEGTLKFTSVSAGVAYRVLRGTLSPFVSAGGIFQFSSFTLDNANLFAPTGFTVNQSVDEGVGAFVAGGLHYHLNPRFSLFATARYAFIHINMNVQGKDNLTGELFNNKVSSIKLNPLWLGIFVGYSF